MEANASTKSEPTEHTRVAVASNAEEYRSRIAKRLRAVKGRMCGGKATEEQIADRLLDASANKRSDEPTERTRAAVAKRERAINANPLGSNQYRKVDLSDALTDKSSDKPKTDTRAAVASNAEEYRSRIAKRLRAVAGYSAVVRDEETGKFNRLSADASDKRSDEPKTGTRAAVAN